MYRHAFEIKCKIDQQHRNTGRSGIREQRREQQHALVWRPFRSEKRRSREEEENGTKNAE